MLAIINLFVYILKYPTLRTAQSDMALLDIGAGHFGQVHHLTSGHVSFQFPREVSAFANKAIKRATGKLTDETREMASMNSCGEVSSDLNDIAVSSAVLWLFLSAADTFLAVAPSQPQPRPMECSVSGLLQRHWH